MQLRTDNLIEGQKGKKKDNKFDPGEVECFNEDYELMDLKVPAYQNKGKHDIEESTRE